MIGRPSKRDRGGVCRHQVPLAAAFAIECHGQR